MRSWEYEGVTYRTLSMYLVPGEAWTYELTGSPSTAAIAVVIPDATPGDNPFTPSDAGLASVAIGGGSLPWPALMRFVHFVEDSGDIVGDVPARTVTGDFGPTLNAWHFADREFEVNSFHHGDRDSWCYELYEVNPDSTANDFVVVCISDPQPAAVHQVTFEARGNPEIPWPVFKHFLDAVVTAAGIVE